MRVRVKACPVCGSTIAIEDGFSLECNGCGATRSHADIKAGYSAYMNLNDDSEYWETYNKIEDAMEDD